PLEGHVWDLLREADKTTAEHQDEEQVYEAMAESLGDAWDSLTIVLEKRRTLLKLSLDFFENALEFAAKIDQVEDFLQYSQEFENPESLKELLHQHKLHTKDIIVLLGNCPQVEDQAMTEEELEEDILNFECFCLPSAIPIAKNPQCSRGEIAEVQ
ncbi:hypothetical protein Chor_015847, partial [Crotalus horridus]